MAGHPEIRPEQSIPLLQELHILTRDGKLNQDSRRKLKQINHLCQFIQPLLAASAEAKDGLCLVDHGAGKSYLGFILYDLFFKSRPQGEIFSIESRPELVQRSRLLAERLGFERMRFLNLTVEESLAASEIPQRVEIVTALHACNTATDDAIRFALAKQADYVVLIPCCQAEVAAMLRNKKAASLSQGAMAELWRHAIHTREFGSHITNVLRCLLLEAHGYQLTVTELVGWEHSLKNELIIGRRLDKPRGNARQRTLEILDSLNLMELAPRFAY